MRHSDRYTDPILTPRLCIIETSVTLFARQKGEPNSYLYWFSVAGGQLSSHSVVLFDGDNSGMGSWICMKDHESACRHVLLAQNELQEMLEVGGSHIEEWREPNAGLGRCSQLSCLEIC